MPMESFNSNNITETTFIWKLVSLLSNGWETSNAAQCVKSRSLTKAVDLILDIEFFEHKFVYLKSLL